ncbi:hypothetical protein GOBAR_DD18067 [Gossypium barbadense]|nr:hypothetical protein GOBAR_DD18067 [Gossypium barbadense]
MSINLISLVSILKKWNKEVYKHIATRKRSLARHIENVQAALDHKCSKFLLELEMDLRFEYEKVLDEEELLLLQKFRIDWIHQGDGIPSSFIPKLSRGVSLTESLL